MSNSQIVPTPSPVLLIVLALGLAGSSVAYTQENPPSPVPPAVPEVVPTPAPGKQGVLMGPAQLQIVAELRTTPGNIAVAPDGRIFLSQHPFAKPRNAVVELTQDGKTRPYPNKEWTSPVDKNGIGMQAVLGLKVDGQGILWMLDAGDAGAGLLPKLVAWNLAEDRLHRVIHLAPPASTPTSFLQELALDQARQRIYLADCGNGNNAAQATPAIVVVDLATGQSRRVLENADALRGEGAPMVIEGKQVTSATANGTLEATNVGINPLAIDPAGKWVYFGPMNGETIYRIPAETLANLELSDKALESKVEKHGTKGVSDGFILDEAGNIYVSDVTNNAIGLLSAQGEYRLLLQDAERLSWPNAFSYAPDGHFYVTVAQLHRHPVLNGGKNATRPPFYVVRFKPLAPGGQGL